MGSRTHIWMIGMVVSIVVIDQLLTGTYWGYVSQYMPSMVTIYEVVGKNQELLLFYSIGETIIVQVVTLTLSILPFAYASTKLLSFTERNGAIMGIYFIVISSIFLYLYIDHLQFSFPFFWGNVVEAVRLCISMALFYIVFRVVNKNQPPNQQLKEKDASRGAL